MPRLPPLAALLALGLTATAHADPVRPAWTLRNATFLGFTAGGDLVTRPRAREGGDAPVLERRDPRTGERKGMVVFPEVGSDLGILAFTPDLKTFAWMNRAGDTLAIRTPEKRWSSSLPGLRGTWDLVFSPDGRTLAARNVNGYVQLWDVQKGERRATLLLHSQPRSLTFHPTQPLLAVNESGQREGSVTLWNTDTGEKVLTVPGLTGTLRPFQFAPDGRLLLQWGDRAGFLQMGLEGLRQGEVGLSVQSLPTYTEPCPPGIQAKLCARDVRHASFNADGSLVLLNIARTAQNVPASLLYDAKTGRLLRDLDTPVAQATLTPNGKRLILNTFQGEVQGVPLP